MSKLTNKQRLFIDYYLQCWNATEAAKKAGYSEDTAYNIGWENVRKREIRAEIDKRLEESLMSANEVLALLNEQATLNPDDFLDITDRGGYVLNLNKAKERGKLHLIEKIVPTREGTKLEFHNKQRALELIGKALGLFTDKIEHGGTIENILIVKLPDNERD